MQVGQRTYTIQLTYDTSVCGVMCMETILSDSSDYVSLQFYSCELFSFCIHGVVLTGSNNSVVHGSGVDSHIPEDYEKQITMLNSRVEGQLAVPYTLL